MRESERRMAHSRVQALTRTVRRRWRLRLALRGLAWVAGVTGMVLFLSALGLERLRFSPDSVVLLRALTWSTFGSTFFFLLVRPLLKRVTDDQVALYLEEHEPSLEHAVVTALEAGGMDAVSPELGSRLVDNALDRARQVGNGRRVEQSNLYRFAGVLTGMAVLALSLSLLGPAHLRLGLAALLVPTKDAASVNPYAVAVLPGDAIIARGSDQLVTATLSGFDAADASIFTRSGPDRTFQRLSMLQTEDGSFEALLLGVNDETEYFVESTGIRSGTFTIEVADLPYVDQLDLTYYFPRYTALPPRTIEDGGDVAALPGTVVELHVQPTMAAPGGRILIDGEPIEDLTVQDDGSLLGRFTVSERGFYSIQLARDGGALVAASPEYTIDLLTDQEPTIQFTEPGRDATASPIEEVYLGIRANDDYGIGDVRIVYAVNGGPEDTISVFRASNAPLAEVATGHTLFLEEWPLEVGDLVSYYAIARDNRSGTPKQVTSDIYFLNIRPFERAYREGEQQGGGQGQGGQAGPETALSELQRQIIAATFNLIRQEETYDRSELHENIVSVSLAQGRLQEQVMTLLERMQNRGLTETDPGFRDVSAILPKASEAMAAAREDLDAKALRDALPDEQTALRFLQQAEETYERYVVEQQEQPAGGGGGGGQQAAEDLADLFELELDKLKNQYETVRRGQQEQADDQVDELMEQLEELARRQQQEAERQRRRAQAGQSGQNSGGASQRDLAEQAEEAARQLQRLARENNDPQLEETARQLERAAESMRQAASQSGSAGVGESQSALDRLAEAQRRLEDARSERAARDAANAIERVEALQQQQRDMQRAVRGLPEDRAERTQRVGPLRERKDQMNEAVTELERELDRAEAAGRADNPQAARALGEAADQIRESKLKEKLQYSRGTIEQWDPQSAVTLELNIEADLQALRDQLGEAANAASAQREVDPLEEALDRTRDLVRSMEAIERRLNEPGSGEQGQEGQQGREGQQGQGQQGQGQQGQGQQGQGQQGQGQQGQGQQGQGQQGQGQQGQGPGQQGGDRNQGGGGPAGVDRTDPTDGFAGGATRGNPRPLSPEEIRQLQREFTQRSGQVRDLRNQLQQAGRPAEELRAVLEAMERLEKEGVYADPAQVRDLQEQILAMLKGLEFGLRREVEGEAGRSATLSGSDEVPEGYRTLVEEYYRALARGRRGGGGG